MTTDAVIFRRALAEDYEAILRLQSAHYVANLAEEDRKEGFLSAEFSQRQVAEMAEDLGVMIAVDSGAVVGYLCAFRNEFNHGSPVLAEMVKSYPRVLLEGQPLSSYDSYIYGPVCIAKAHRQRGLLRGLYEAQIRDLAGRFEIGVAFVSRTNPHSLQAHVGGLRMSDVGDFEVRGNIYAILAFRVPARAV